MYKLQEEVVLLRAALEGNVDAWGEIIERYKQAVFGLSLGYLRQPADAEDITHDTFIRAYENLRRYRLERRFSTWILTIAANLCKNRLRHRRYHPVRASFPQSDSKIEPENVIAGEDRQARVREALSRLPGIYRAPLVLRYYNELSYKEIAKILSLPQGTVKTRIHRGRLQLKKEIEKSAVIQHEKG